MIEEQNSGLNSGVEYRVYFNVSFLKQMKINMKRPITVNGQNLKLELEDLVLFKAKVVEAIAEARSHGDLKENAEYHGERTTSFNC